MSWGTVQTVGLTVLDTAASTIVVVEGGAVLVVMNSVGVSIVVKRVAVAVTGIIVDNVTVTHPVPMEIGGVPVRIVLSSSEGGWPGPVHVIVMASVAATMVSGTAV